MFSRWATPKNAQRTLRQSKLVYFSNSCRFASSSFSATSPSYGVANVADVKIACRDVAGPTTRLAIIAKAGTRYETAPGLSAGLAMFAFKVGAFERPFCLPPFKENLCHKANIL